MGPALSFWTPHENGLIPGARADRSSSGEIWERGVALPSCLQPFEAGRPNEEEDPAGPAVWICELVGRADFGEQGGAKGNKCGRQR